MGIRITGTALLWAAAMLGGLLAVRATLRQKLENIVHEAANQSTAAMNFDADLELSFPEPVIPQGILYQPEP